MTLFFFLFVFLFSCLSAEPKKLSLKVSAQTAIMIDAKTGEVLYEKNPHQKMYPSSITKIATAYYFLEKMGEARLDEEVVAPRDCLTVVPDTVRSDANCPSYRLDPRGTRMWLIEGEKVSYRTLLYGAMLPSGNDASNVLAYYCSGSIEQFMEELNQFIRQFGVKNTKFTNPHGLPDTEHYTTAFDMAYISRAAMRNRAFRTIVKTEVYPRAKTNKQPASTLPGHNLLVRKGPYYYPKATGIKTGGAFLSKNTLVASAEDENRSLIVVLLGCNDRKQRFRDAVALFEAAFTEAKVRRTFFAKGWDTFSYEIQGAKESVQGALSQDLTLEYYPSQEPEAAAQIQWGPLQMPVRGGDYIGDLQLVSKTGQLLKVGPIFAAKDVEPTRWFQVKRGVHANRVEILCVVSLLGLGAAIAWMCRKRGAQRGQ